MKDPGPSAEGLSEGVTEVELEVELDVELEVAVQAPRILGQGLLALLSQRTQVAVNSLSQETVQTTGAWTEGGWINERRRKSQRSFFQM